ncbi:RL39-like protein, partial [Mya arenaria]
AAHKSFRIKMRLAKKQKQNRPIPQWLQCQEETLEEDKAEDVDPAIYCYPGTLVASKEECTNCDRSPNIT